MKQFFLILALFVWPLFVTAQTVNTTEPKKEQQDVMVKLIKPIAVKTDTTAKALFAELTPAALKKGLDKVVLSGVVSKKPLVGAYEVSIVWNKLLESSEPNAKSTFISPPLRSVLKVKKPEVPADKPFKAKGNMDSLAVKAQELKRVSSSLEDKADEDEKDKDKRDTKGTGGAGSGTSGGVSGGTENGEIPSLDAAKEAVTYEACLDRIDYDEGSIYRQEREVVKDDTGRIVTRGDCVDTGSVEKFNNTEKVSCGERYDQAEGLIYELTSIQSLNESGTPIGITDCSDSGTTYPPIVTYADCEFESTGETINLRHEAVFSNNSGIEIDRGDCVDTGSTTPILREYNTGCSDSVDLNKLLAYKRFDTYAMINNERVDFKSCTFDLSEGLNLTSSYDGCTVKHNFVEGFSTQQESYYYSENGSDVSVTDCLVSDITYAHYNTIEGCSAQLDTINNTVIEYTQTAYDSSGQSFYPSSCQPSSNGEVSLTEEFCTGEISHDFSSGQSNQQTRFFYVSQSGSIEYATACANSSTTYAHVESADDCTPRVDDAGLKYYLSTNIKIDIDGALTEIDSCSERNGATAYSDLGKKYFILSSVSDEVLTYNECAFTCGCWAGTRSVVNRSFNAGGQVYGWVYNGVMTNIGAGACGKGDGVFWKSATRINRIDAVYFNRYLRPDGSYHDKQITAYSGLNIAPPSAQTVTTYTP